MSTQALIGRLLEDGKVRAIYLHSDGDSAGNDYLCNFYQSPEKVEALIELGSLSELGIELGPKPPEQPEYSDIYSGLANYCLAYMRDRGEDAEDNEPIMFENVKEYETVLTIQFRYLYRDGKWFVFEKGRLKGWSHDGTGTEQF
jgi:hypothetical protein